MRGKGSLGTKRNVICYAITADIFVATVNTRIVLVIAVQLTVLQYGLIILHLLVKNFFVRQNSISGC